MDNILEKRLVTSFGLQYYIPVRKAVGIYIIWIALHFSLLVFGNSWFSIHDYFYPIGDFSFSIFDFEDYDITEFMFYAIFPAICVLVDINLPIKIKNQIIAKVKTRSKYFFALVTWTIFNLLYLTFGLFYRCSSIILFFFLVPILLLYSIKYFKTYSIIVENKSMSKPIFSIIIFVLLAFILILGLELKNKTRNLDYQEDTLDEVQTELEENNNNNYKLEKDVEGKESEIERLENDNHRLEYENRKLENEVEELENIIREMQRN